MPIEGFPTLRDEAKYITKLPKAEQDQDHWQLAVEMLLRASGHDAWIMFARMAMLKAMQHGKPALVKQRRRKRAKAYRIVT